MNIFAISDSSGETAMQVAKTSGAQFGNAEINYERYPFITTESMLLGILKIASQKHAVIFYTLVSTSLCQILKDFTSQHNLQCVDCLQTAIKAIETQLGAKPKKLTGMSHNLNEDYFKRIAAMEFSVENDDGSHPENLIKADVVILGISRTSKTPLSLYLANKKIKTANLPIGPSIQLPKEIWDVDSKKIFGLTSNSQDIKRIRQNRMKSYGLDGDTPYSNASNIKQELEYANNLYYKIGCPIINVHDKSIEETATIIMESLNLDTKSY
jgi:[pyruvate, water dikinase]-phosphate phosphotransferase / [pyruvate, water dikinase] kinase